MEAYREKDAMGRERIVYECAGERDGCYYCGNPLHRTSDCHQELETDEMEIGR